MIEVPAALQAEFICPAVYLLELTITASCWMIWLKADEFWADSWHSLFFQEGNIIMKQFVAVALAAVSVLLGAPVYSFSASLEARINVSAQTMTVSRHGRVIYRWRVSTARKGYFTPRGSYRPTRLHRMWYSRRYDMSPMPYSIFFKGGYAIHGTNYVKSLGRPASHGCVRLDTSNAAKLYSLVKAIGPRNTRIVVVN